MDTRKFIAVRLNEAELAILDEIALSQKIPTSRGVMVKKIVSERLDREYAKSHSDSIKYSTANK